MLSSFSHLTTLYGFAYSSSHFEARIRLYNTQKTTLHPSLTEIDYRGFTYGQ
ncbi:MAG: hypothetical protein K0U47_00400 [Epsilonproteobacteria bacterium]|nr:hypothetical protein [Campylobacterota bacterium]